MEIRRIDACSRERINRFLALRWFSPQMAIRGEMVDLSCAPGFYMLEDQAVSALITYRVQGDMLEILSLDSLFEGRGAGSALLDETIAEAVRLGCRRVVLVTTNDNLEALRFYQKRGFDLCGFYRNALREDRRIKPEIPLLGREGIPLRHEIELERVL